MHRQQLLHQEHVEGLKNNQDHVLIGVLRKVVHNLTARKISIENQTMKSVCDLSHSQGLHSYNF